MSSGEGDLSASNSSTTAASPDIPRELQKYPKDSIKSTIVESYHESSFSLSNKRFSQTVSQSYDSTTLTNESSCSSVLSGSESLDDSPNAVTSDTREEDSNLSSLDSKSDPNSESDNVVICEPGETKTACMFQQTFTDDKNLDKKIASAWKTNSQSDSENFVNSENETSKTSSMVPRSLTDLCSSVAVSTSDSSGKLSSGCAFSRPTLNKIFSFTFDCEENSRDTKITNCSVTTQLSQSTLNDLSKNSLVKQTANTFPHNDRMLQFEKPFGDSLSKPFLSTASTSDRFSSNLTSSSGKFSFPSNVSASGGITLQSTAASSIPVPAAEITHVSSNESGLTASVTSSLPFSYNLPSRSSATTGLPVPASPSMSLGTSATNSSDFSLTPGRLSFENVIFTSNSNSLPFNINFSLASKTSANSSTSLSTTTSPFLSTRISSPGTTGTTSTVTNSSDCVQTPSCFSMGNASFTSNNTALPFNFNFSLASKTSDSASTSTNFSAPAFTSASTSDIMSFSSACVLTPSHFSLGNVCSSEVTPSSFCKSSVSASSYSSLGIATSTPETALPPFTTASVFASVSTGMPFQPCNPPAFISDNRLSKWPPPLPTDSPRLVDFEGLSQDLGNLLEKKLNPDVHLNCNGQTFPAHKSILAARSDFFAGLFKKKIAKTGIQKIAFNDVEPEFLGMFLKCIYTGTLQEKLSVDMVCQLYAAACKYSVRCLCKVCLDFMISSLSEKNYLQFLKVAHHDDKLKEAVAVFLTKEREDFLKSSDWWKFTKEEPKIAFEVRYMKYAYDHVPNCLPVLIPAVSNTSGFSFGNALSTSLTTAPWSFGTAFSTSVATTLPFIASSSKCPHPATRGFSERTLITSGTKTSPSCRNSKVCLPSDLTTHGFSFLNTISTPLTTTQLFFGSSGSTSVTTASQSFRSSTLSLHSASCTSKFNFGSVLSTSVTTTPLSFGSGASTSGTTTSPSIAPSPMFPHQVPRGLSKSTINTSDTMTSPSSKSWLETVPSAPSTESVTDVSTSHNMTSPSSRSWLEAIPSAPKSARSLAELLLEAANTDRLSFGSTVNALVTTTTSIVDSFVSQSGSVGSAVDTSVTTTAPSQEGVIFPPKDDSVEASSSPSWNTSSLYQPNLEYKYKILSINLDVLLKNKLFPDVHLKCEDQIFPAHKGILATRSNFFRNMFTQESDDSSGKEIIIRGLKPETLRILLKFIYSATLPTVLSEDSVCELFSASLKYDVFPLSTECVDLMIEHLTKENYLKLLTLSDKSHCYCRRLLKAIKNFVSNRNYLLKSEDWKRFSDKEPRLANKIYEAIFEDLLKLSLISKTELK